MSDLEKRLPETKERLKAKARRGGREGEALAGGTDGTRCWRGCLRA